MKCNCKSAPDYHREDCPVYDTRGNLKNPIHTQSTYDINTLLNKEFEIDNQTVIELSNVKMKEYFRAPSPAQFGTLLLTDHTNEELKIHLTSKNNLDLLDNFNLNNQFNISVKLIKPKPNSNAHIWYDFVNIKEI